MSRLSEINGIGPEIREDEEQNPQVAQVFNMALLLETILEYGLHEYDSSSHGQKLCRKNLVNLREISRSWKEAVSKVLKKNEEPLYTVTMTPENALNGTSFLGNNGRILDKFVRFLATLKGENVYRAFAINAPEEEVFRLGIYDNLVTFLGQYGGDLVELNLTIPENGGSFPGLFPNTVTLPALRKLKLELYRHKLENLPEFETRNLSPDNLTLLLQSLLTSSPGMKELIIKGTNIPSSFQFMGLPASLTGIDMDCKENLHVLQCLIRNRLPELKNLQIEHLLDKADLFEASDLLYEICQRFAKTLRVLSLPQNGPYIPPRRPILLRFPVMEKLETLFILGMHSELDTGIPSVSNLFPKLTTLTLMCHTADMLQKWVGAGTPAPLVSTIELEMGDEMTSENEGCFNTRPIPVDILRNVCLTFPNITDLTLYHSGTRFEDVQYVFREMRQLKRLALTGMGTGPDSLGNSSDWDAMLIGAPVEHLMGLRAWPNLFKKFQPENSNAPSIRMLEELTYLSLNAELSEGMGSLISDLCFTYALNMMSKLEHVRLIGLFSVSEELMKEWKDKGRKMECKMSFFN